MRASEQEVVKDLQSARGLPVFVQLRGLMADNIPLAVATASWAHTATLKCKQRVLVFKRTDVEVARRLAEDVFRDATDILGTPARPIASVDADMLAAVNSMLAQPPPMFRHFGHPFAFVAPPSFRSATNNVFGADSVPVINASMLRHDVSLRLFKGLFRFPSVALVFSLVEHLFPSIGSTATPAAFVHGLDLLLSDAQSELGLVADRSFTYARHDLRQRPQSLKLLGNIVLCLSLDVAAQPILAQAARIHSALENLDRGPMGSARPGGWPGDQFTAEFAHVCVELQRECMNIAQDAVNGDVSGPFYFAVLDLIFTPCNGDLILKKYRSANTSGSKIIDIDAVTDALIDGSKAVAGRLGIEFDMLSFEQVVGEFFNQYKSKLGFWTSNEAHAPQFAMLRSIVNVLAGLPYIEYENKAQDERIYKFCLDFGSAE